MAAASAVEESRMEGSIAKTWFVVLQVRTLSFVEQSYLPNMSPVLIHKTSNKLFYCFPLRFVCDSLFSVKRWTESKPWKNWSDSRIHYPIARSKLLLNEAICLFSPVHYRALVINKTALPIYFNLASSHHRLRTGPFSR